MERYLACKKIIIEYWIIVYVRDGNGLQIYQDIFSNIEPSDGTPILQYVN